MNKDTLKGESNCILVKKKEYDELLKQRDLLWELQNSKDITIKINWEDIVMGEYRYFNDVVISTKINLSNSIQEQVRRILTILNNRFNEELGNCRYKYEKKIESLQDIISVTQERNEKYRKRVDERINGLTFREKWQWLTGKMRIGL